MAPPPSHLAFWKRVDTLIALAFEEDLPGRDITTEAVLAGERSAGALIVTREEITVSGLGVARRVFETVDPDLRWSQLVEDGGRACAGSSLASVEGSARSLLAGERTAVNFLQHLCGIATCTRRTVDLVENFPVRVLDTRKTLPGWRLLEKEAVRDGGGTNHRFSLSDGVLIKDNHISLAGSVAEALRRARAALPPGSRIEVEAATIGEVREALEGGADVILIDNADPELLAETVRAVDGKVPLEASGGVDRSNIVQVARAGVQMISVGALTHSARAVDISMEISGL